ATLTWSTTNAVTVTIDQGIATVAASGTRSVSPTTTTTYVLTATNGVGSVTSTTTVTIVPVTPPPPPPTCPCSIWSPSTIPSAMDTDASALEIGLKFRADVNGTITGIRFYKYAQNTGTHVGNLWSASGTRLATVTFSGEAASGWQQATFATPVAITA